MNDKQARVEARLDQEMRRIDRLMLILILGHLPVAAFIVPIGYGTMYLGIAGSVLAGVLAVSGYFLLRGHPLRTLNALLLMFISYLFISCQLGRIEMHFHIFGAMAFLVIYRDWKIYTTLTVFVALHHGIVSYCQSINVEIAGIPLKVFNYGEGFAWDIVLLHAVFVVFEASILIYLSHYLRRNYTEQEARNIELQELRDQGNREIVAEVRGTTGRFQDSAGHLLGMAGDLSDKATTQASSLEEISASMEEMSTGLEDIFSTTIDQANGIGDLYKKMEELQRLRNSVTRDIQTTMASVRETVTAARSGEKSLSVLNDSISEIVNSVEQMRDIVSIINDIADKVNLLSLNASIEAARAGEAGRGFTVVAEEIAKLADRTGQSIKDIGNLIETSTRQAEDGRKNMEESSAVLHKIIADVDSMNSLSDSISESIQNQQSQHGQVTDRLKSLNTNSDFIKNASEEQRKMVRQILETLLQLNNSTEVYANSAARLNDIARENDTVTKDFARKVDELTAAGAAN